jgi:hypothetical protein
MSTLFKRRPLTGTVIAFVALCVALGGGAYAVTSHKVEYKDLSKQARKKVLPVSSTNANTSGTPCDPGHSYAHPTAPVPPTACTQVFVDGSKGFPRRYLVVLDGVVQAYPCPLCSDPPPPAASGECRLELDGTPINDTTTGIYSQVDASAGFGINTVTKPLKGKHRITVACTEASGDLKIPTYELSAIQVR